MNQRKLAISLAVIGAIAAPFAFRIYKMRPVSEMFVPYTAQEKERVAAYFKEVNNRQTITDKVVPLPSGTGRTAFVFDDNDAFDLLKTAAYLRPNALPSPTSSAIAAPAALLPVKTVFN